MANLPINILAEWDPEASVWVATSDDVYGLAVESPTLETLAERLPGVLEDLIEGNHPELAGLKDIPFKVNAFMTGHLASLGATTVSRDRYAGLLGAALSSAGAGGSAVSGSPVSGAVALPSVPSGQQPRTLATLRWQRRWESAL